MIGLIYAHNDLCIYAHQTELSVRFAQIIAECAAHFNMAIDY